jgi:hypothetical protein
MATHSTDRIPDGENGTGQIPAHVVDELLASRARRRLLRCLRGAENPVPVDDLAADLAGSEAEDERSEAGETAVPTNRRKTRIDIYQKHLPKLTETGLVAFDSRLGTVAFTGGPRVTARLEEES